GGDLRFACRVAKALARIIRGKTEIEVQPFRNEGKTVVP
ncbi:MAG: hypothetical protein HW419_3622, partial [Deltaproteobacteria bacterium]|nr:hypothetical protein [Deltaproteobacteria bacterium]